MVIETAKNQIVLNQIIAKKKETRQIETDVIVNDIKPDVLKVISTSGIVNVYKKETINGKIKVEGVINAYIIYLADDENGNIRSLNTSLDFTQIIDMENCKEGMETKIDVSIKSFETSIINGRKLNIKANVENTISIYANENIDIIADMDKNENIQVLKNTGTITSLKGNGSNKVIIKDTLAVDIADDIAEIMKVDFKIINSETKISYNKVLSKSEAKVEILYLTEDNRINTIATTIPVMGFVDIQDVNEMCSCEVQNNLSNLIIKPNTTEEHSIYVEAEIEVICSAYETKEISIIEDLYSLTDEMQFDRKEVTAVTERNNIKDNCIVKENIRIPELTGKVLNVQIKPLINNQQIRNEKIIYEGNINLEILFEQNNGINLREIELPFNFEVNSDKINEKSSIETLFAIKQNDFVIKDGIIEATIGIEFDISEQKSKTLNIIQNVKIEESKDCNNYSMIIYFIKQGDSLWSIAKMFKSTVEDIAKINEIENPDKINVGEQLYIPRYCKRITANG